MKKKNELENLKKGEKMYLRNGVGGSTVNADDLAQIVN